MKVHKDWIGSKKPATQGDLADLQEDIHVDLQQFATKQDLKDAVEKLATKESVASILEIVKSIDRQLKEWRDIPEELVKLKNRVFKLELGR